MRVSSTLLVFPFLTLALASTRTQHHRRAQADNVLENRGHPGPLARHAESAISHLSPAVRRALAERDAAGEHYELFPRADRWVEGGSAHDKAATWTNGHGPGRGQCHHGTTAVTYDDGVYDWHADLAELYHNHSMSFTSFVNGNNWRCIYDMADEIKRGHELGVLYGNHGWSHLNSTAISLKELDEQIELVEEALLKIIGVVPAYFRPPYGETNREILHRLKHKHGVTVVQWSDDAGDADGLSAEHSIHMYEKFRKGEDHLVLNHEVKHPSVYKVAPAAIRHFKKEGIKSVTADKCLKGRPSPYKVVAKPQKRDHTWTCAGKPQPLAG